MLELAFSLTHIFPYKVDSENGYGEQVYWNFKNHF